MDNIWKVIKDIIHGIVFKILHLKQGNTVGGGWRQFIKFGLVGISNTLISYIVYVVLIMFSVQYLLASFLGFLLSVINAYYWNARYVFRAEEGETQAWWRVFLKTFASYAGTGLVMNNILLMVWVDVLGIHKMLGPVINLFITIPLNFLLNKYWAFKKRG